MQLARSVLFMRLAARSCLARSFAKKKAPKEIRIVDRDEYDLETALKLLKASSVSHADESIDILIK